MSCASTVTEVSVFPATASFQTGFPLRSNTFQLLCFFFLTPGTCTTTPSDIHSESTNQMILDKTLNV